jgi:hypothetical protein
MTRIKDLFGAAEAAPFQHQPYIEFFLSQLGIRLDKKKSRWPPTLATHQTVAVVLHFCAIALACSLR